jgi:ribosomal protein S30
MTEEIMGLGPDDPRIRELFPENMPAAEIQKIWESLEGSWWSKLIDEGKNFRMSLSLRSAMGLGKEPTPTWEMVADDVRYKLEEMVEKGRFTDIMTPQGIRELQVRMEEAMAARSDDYSRYKVDRDKLDADEERIISEMEDDFNAGRDTLTWNVPDPDTGEMIRQERIVHKGDTRAYLDAVNRMRGAFGGRRSNLVGPEGKYRGVTDLFNFANGTALGTLSTFDSDVYDFAEASYYQVLYEPTRDNGKTLSSIVLADGTIDWDLRDQKLEIWAKRMKEQFPDKSAKEIQGFRVRVEKARKDKASPIAMVLLNMQDYIRDTVLDPVRAPGVTYYGIEEAEANKIIEAHPRLATLADYKTWKNASSKVRSVIESKNPWLKALKTRTDTTRKLLLGRHPQAAAVLKAMGSGPADAYNRKALEVKTILRNHQSGKKNIPDMAQFLADVYNMEDLDRYLTR